MNVQSHSPKPQMLTELPSHTTKAAELHLRLRLSKSPINRFNTCLDLLEKHKTFWCRLQL